MLPNYIITRVQYSKNSNGNTVISNAKVGKINKEKESVSIPISWTRQEIVEKLEKKYTFATATEESDKTYKVGADIIIVEINDVKYIRTDGNETEADNLGELPSF